MSRVSHSLLDPLIAPLVPRLYSALHIPRRMPPEVIVGIGHLVAIGGALGFAYSTDWWWAALIGAAGVAGNHVADMVDGTHARRTNQCRNGGELLDHFTDPLSFCYWLIGISVSCQALALGLVTVILIYATALLTNIKAKILGEFTLARFGPTEFKGVLVLYGIGIAIAGALGAHTPTIAFVTMWVLIVVGVLQLILNLILGVNQVNRKGPAADTSEWKIE